MTVRVNDIFSHSFACTSYFDTSIPMDNPKDVPIILDPPLPVVPLGDPKGNDDFEIESGIEELDTYDEQKHFYEDKHFVKEIPLLESCDMLVYKVTLLIFSLLNICPLTPLT